MKKLDGFDIIIIVGICAITLAIACGVGSEMVKEVAKIMAGCG